MKFLIQRTLIIFSIIILNACSILDIGKGDFLTEPLPVKPINALFATPTANIFTPEPTFTPESAPTLQPTAIPITSILFTGVIVPARCVQDNIEKIGSPDYMYANVKEIISGADLAVGTLNAIISDEQPTTGCIQTFMLVGSGNNADAMANAGFDLMSVATNHIKNCSIPGCGNSGFLDTMDNLERVGITPVGAGLNLADAEKPVVVTINGVRFGFVSLGEIEPISFADEDTPGIAVLTEESLRRTIQDAKEVADVVIAMPHWGPEDDPLPKWGQRRLGNFAVEAGAELVVGNHTHVIQAYREVDGVMVFFGLGNFIFDQIWARDHMQGMILIVRFEGTEFLDFQLIPTLVDATGEVILLTGEEADEVMSRLAEVNEVVKDQIP